MMSSELPLTVEDVSAAEQNGDVEVVDVPASPQAPTATQIVKADKPYGGLEVFGGPTALKQQLADQLEMLHIIDEFVQANLVRDVDYGIADERSPKKTLLQPGAEKVIRAFSCKAEFQVDNDTLEALGKPKDVIAYVCHIVHNRTGMIVGEGRGAEKVGNKARDTNKTIKEAQKCALVDAVKRTFALSNRFTQDDGGAGNAETTLADAKAALKDDVANLRRNCGSSMTDVQFIVRVLEQLLNGRKNIQTKGECEYVHEQVIGRKAFDLATGERIPNGTAR